MSKVTLNAKIRDEIGKSAVRKLRRNGIIPGVVYGPHEDTFSVKVDANEFYKTVHPEKSHTTLVHLEFTEDEREDLVTVIKEIQREPIYDDILHIDFQYLHEGEPLELDVPVVIEGMAKGVKEGGVLDQILRKLHVKCLPKDIPENIVLDVSPLEVGDGIHISDLDYDNFEVMNPPEAVIVTILGEKALATLEEIEGLEEEEEEEAAEVPEIGEEEAEAEEAEEMPEEE